MCKISFISYCITWLVFPHRANKKNAKYREEKRQQQHLKCIFCFSIIISIEFFFIVKHRRSLPKIFRCRILCALCIHYTVYIYYYRVCIEKIYTRAICKQQHKSCLELCSKSSKMIGLGQCLSNQCTRLFFFLQTHIHNFCI